MLISRDEAFNLSLTSPQTKMQRKTKTHIPVTAILLPEPTYSGPDNVIYFRSLANLDEELAHNPNRVWLIAFYTVWNPACVNFAPIFAQLSNDYDLENLKFGKIDVGRYPDAGEKYKVSDSSLSKQLPTVVMFREGKEYMRRPIADSKGKLVRFLFSGENVVAAFDLKNVYEDCKGRLKDNGRRLKSE